jgi:ring-1,2-phenylacetyl-CoA epoxidase subunit PaaE
MTDTVAVDSPDDLHGFTPLRVTSVEHDPHDCVLVTFDTTEHPDRFAFTHGQHVNLRRRFGDVEVRRSYSICSPARGGDLRIAVRQVPDGVFSSWATQELKAGDHVEVTAPTGHFTHELDPEAARRYTFIAAGSGITPIYGIMATILHDEPRSTGSLWYLNRTSNSAMLLDDLQDLRDRFLDRLSIAYAFSREDTGSELLSGRPDRARFDRLIEVGLVPADVDHAFLCGPLALIGEAADALTDAGLPRERLHREIFTTKQVGTVTLAPQQITETSVAVARGRATLHGRTSDFELYAGDSVLDAVQRVRPDAPFSCRSGVCSTCQAILREGDVTMAVNYGLTDDEVARGYVLTCQSQPVSDRIVVDYDA